MIRILVYFINNLSQSVKFMEKQVSINYLSNYIHFIILNVVLDISRHFLL